MQRRDEQSSASPNPKIDGPRLIGSRKNHIPMRSGETGLGIVDRAHDRITGRGFVEGVGHY